MGSIAILGLDAAGVSLGLALRGAAGPKGPEVVAFDSRRTPALLAKKAGAAARIAPDPQSAVRGAELVFIATPLTLVRETLEEIAGELDPGCVVTDMAATKAQALRWAQDILPQGISFVGGHPLLDASTRDLQSPDPNLYRDCTYCLIPAPGTAPDAVERVVSAVKAIGATPFFIDAEEHDAFVAGVEILPSLLAAALASVTSRAPAWQEMSRFVFERYRQLGRVAPPDPAAEASACLAATPGVVRWLDECIAELQRYRALVSSGDERLGEVLAEGSRRVKGETPEKHEDTAPGIAAQSFGERFTSLLVGERLSRKARRALGPGRKPQSR